MAEGSIRNLVALRAALPDGDRQLFDRLFAIGGGTGRLVVPDPMIPWVEETYGSVDAVTAQQIVKVTNLWSFQTSLFNPFRAQRPQAGSDSDSLADEIFGDGPDPFDHPEQDTTADTFGRIRGEHTITASNLAKSNVHHGVVIFHEHNPWVVTEDALWDAVQVAMKWFEASRQTNQSAIYPLIIWNCLWKSGASISHAHLQLLLTSGMHYGQIERLRRITVEYPRIHETRYFDDLYRAHAALGLGHERAGVRMYAHLTPLLANECVLLSDTLSEAFVRTIHRVIRRLHEELGLTSFNLAIVPPPLDATDEDWSAMPVVARFVDRGNPLKRTIDTGALELFAASVISTDPFATGRLLEQVQGA